MITQLSGQCFEWDRGNLNMRFFDSETFSAIANHRAPQVRLAKPAFTPEPTPGRFTRDQILPNQMIIAPILAKYGRFELCGSYRRGKETVKDMDYVIETDHAGFANLRDDLTKAGIEFHRGAGEIMNGVLNGIAVDFFRADPESYASILIWRTGSALHNIYCAGAAKRQGMRIKRAGIELRNGKMVHPVDEFDFYKILGIPYMRPEKRDMK